ncbi:hypothetical protein PUN28_016892 [Cardiocondyla obscurior]|uniref:Uncharacterized protein n=1 Tax=Cardiocondyla obscurior TaxID=286306 RepID=A0AAW2EQD9_9HYME
MWYLKHFHCFSKAILLPFIINHAAHINMLYDFVYMLLLRYIKSQFERINNYIQELKEQKKDKVKYEWTISTSPSIHQDLIGKDSREQKIWILMHIHFKLCSISYDLNTVFGWQMVSHVITFHFFTVYVIYNLYVVTVLIYAKCCNRLVDLYCMCFWIVVHITKMIVFNYICEGVCTKVQKIYIFVTNYEDIQFTLRIYILV